MSWNSYGRLLSWPFAARASGVVSKCIGEDLGGLPWVEAVSTSLCRKLSTGSSSGDLTFAMGGLDSRTGGPAVLSQLLPPE